MSTFTVEPRRLHIDVHPNADALDLARIDGTEYVAVVRRGEYMSGDVAFYIPEGAIVPTSIISELGLEGRLAGGTIGPDGKKQRDRVKAVRLRQQLSQGLVYRPEGADMSSFEIGTCYAEHLGVSKYVPPIPIYMAGRIEHHPGVLAYTDLENIKRFPHVLVDGEEVVACEKAHGTCSVYGLVHGEFIVSSKGRSASKLVLVEEENNVYWRAARAYGIEEILRVISAEFSAPVVHLYGETVGVQDLRYGLPGGQLSFAAFDVRVGQDFLDFDAFTDLMTEVGLPVCPVIYRGPYSRDVVEAAATGSEQLTGSETHLREGVVVRPVRERTHDDLGRVILKVISPDYLLRGGDATELE